MRLERDAMGTIEISDEALWGAQTQRAVENFRISGVRFGRYFFRALGQIKRACACANIDLGLLDRDLGQAIIRACDEMIQGELDHQFPVDIFQTGSGTSTNMNANEVIANRAIQILGGEIGSRSPVHPNDHVNFKPIKQRCDPYGNPCGGDPRTWRETHIGVGRIACCSE